MKGEEKPEGRQEGPLEGQGLHSYALKLKEYEKSLEYEVIENTLKGTKRHNNGNMGKQKSN